MHHAFLKLLMASFFLFFAFPDISLQFVHETVFWLIWTTLCLFVIGSNLSTIFRITQPPKLEQKTERIRYPL
ncbi:MAG TPA: hypothetical protein VK061_07595 [Bacillota bacterium]|nr:hypothetical protein [Bacillota bacterium]